MSKEARPQGRMITVALADDDGFARLSQPAAVLFLMILPHLSAHGKMNGGQGYIKDVCCPLIPYITAGNLESLLTEISSATSLKWFRSGGRWWIHALNFSRHQNMSKYHQGKDGLPDYPGTAPQPSGDDLGMIGGLSADDPRKIAEPSADDAAKDKVKDKVQVKGEGDHRASIDPIKIHYPERPAPEQGNGGTPPASGNGTREKADRDRVNQIVAAWNRMAEEAGLTKVMEVTPARRAAVLARLAEGGGKDIFWWLEAVSAAGHLRRKNWAPDFDLFFSSTKIAIQALEAREAKTKPNGAGNGGGGLASRVSQALAAKGAGR